MEVVASVRHGLPGIDARPVGPVVIRLKTLAAGQLDIGNHEVQLYAAFVGVFDPEAVVLIGIETGHQRLLEGIHDLALGFLADLALLEGQYARGVALGVLAAVNQRLGLLRGSTEHPSVLTVIVPAQQVPDRPRACSGASGVEFDDHRCMALSSESSRSTAANAATTATRSSPAQSPVFTLRAI